MSGSSAALISSYGGQIISSGLKLNLDAGNIRSYPGTGTTWSDLSGNNNNGTLVNSPVYTSGSLAYFTFNGTNNAVTFSYVQPAQTTLTSFSWNIWVYPTRNNNADVLMGNRGADLSFNKLTTNAAEYYPDVISAPMTINQWQNICFVKNATTLLYYKNGTLLTSITSTVTKSAISFFVGGDPSASEYSTARIAQVLVYDKALSQNEISQNFNVTRNRYGL
jgi:hypothetical protein